MKRKPELRIVVSNAPPPAAHAEAPPEQVEMPFAMVNGEPISQLPHDLYIPPQALEVFLEAFEGPLDLLLYLIRRQNLDILDIPLAEITRQYIKYIELMQELQLELAGEYLVMAATLAEIKSRMLLPRPKAEEGAEEDPRAELVRRLQEYERFKRAAAEIDSLPRLERDVWPTSVELKDRRPLEALLQIALQEMLIAFKEVVARSEMFAHHHIQRARLSVGERMSDILAQLEGCSPRAPRSRSRSSRGSSMKAPARACSRCVPWSPRSRRSTPGAASSSRRPRAAFASRCGASSPARSRGCGRSARPATRGHCSRRWRSSPTASRSRAPRSRRCAAWPSTPTSSALSSSATGCASSATATSPATRSCSEPRGNSSTTSV